MVILVVQRLPPFIEASCSKLAILVAGVGQPLEVPASSVGSTLDDDVNTLTGL